MTCDGGKTKSTPSPDSLGLNCQTGLEFDKRNKQLEAQIANVNALRYTDANMLQQADQEVFVLKSPLQGLSNEKDRLKEKNKQKFKSLKY